MRPDLTSIRRLLVPVGVAVALVLAALAPSQAASLRERCTNHQDAYRVSFPTGWHTNRRVEGGQAEDVRACSRFSPRPFVVHPGSETRDVAVAIGRNPEGPLDPEGGRADHRWRSTGDPRRDPA